MTNSVVPIANPPTASATVAQANRRADSGAVVAGGLRSVAVVVTPGPRSRPARLFPEAGVSPGTTSARDPQKRYDDTVLLLDEISVHGLHSDGGRRAIRRINQMHGSYAIADDDMRYVLARFVVVPKRWMDDYGWRRFTDVEVEASIRYYRELGRLMGIKRLPETYDGFERLLDDYEATHFRYDEAGRRVADMTLALLRSLPPGRGRPGGRVLPRPDGRAAAHRVRLPCAAGPGGARGTGRTPATGPARAPAPGPAYSRPRPRPAADPFLSRRLRRRRVGHVPARLPGAAPSPPTRYDATYRRFPPPWNDRYVASYPGV